MIRTDFERWLDAYRAAWKTDDPAQIGALFTDEASYTTLPFREPRRGRDAIVAWWVSQGDSQNEWQFETERLVVEGDTGVVQGVTTYPASNDSPEAVFSNVWVIRLAADGRASSFAEWWVQRPDPA
jgi:ketosteroid isomerase-like protein